MFTLDPDEGETVTLEGATLIHETAQAVLVHLAETGKKHWFPKRACTAESTIENEGDVGTLVVAQWKAKEEGLV